MKKNKSIFFRAINHLFRKFNYEITTIEYTNHKYDSFSQEGEDRIVKMLLESEKIIKNDVTYLDIGAGRRASPSG